MDIEAQVVNQRHEEGRNGLLERTEIECHDCGDMIYADIDLSLQGNHVIICPCGHEHCRVVKNGRITSARWDQRNGNTAVSTVSGWVYQTGTTASTTTSSSSISSGWWASGTSIYVTT